ncbi:hypothetical protein SCHPADRAFT_420793 [Schizopora paradoxa]|uniref:Uncharacterized protein n=1 Tax=Schizopora paradoxa TaxID=27342 RepID=A0A0H2RK17_9AGAM|nr:hypothetical protein SCHPADRAFT_420793 [Schizopora paradoxa]
MLGCTLRKSGLSGVDANPLALLALVVERSASRFIEPGCYSTGATFGRRDVHAVLQTNNLPRTCQRRFFLFRNQHVLPFVRLSSIPTKIPPTVFLPTALSKRVQHISPPKSFHERLNVRLQVADARDSFFAHERAPMQISVHPQVFVPDLSKFPSAAVVMRTIAHIRLKELNDYSTLPLH